MVGCAAIDKDRKGEKKFGEKGEDKKMRRQRAVNFGAETGELAGDRPDVLFVDANGTGWGRSKNFKVLGNSLL